MRKGANEASVGHQASAYPIPQPPRFEFCDGGEGECSRQRNDRQLFFGKALSAHTLVRIVGKGIAL